MTSWLSTFLPALFTAYLNTMHRGSLASLGKMDLHRTKEAGQEGAGGRMLLKELLTMPHPNTARGDAFCACLLPSVWQQACPIP